MIATEQQLDRFTHNLLLLAERAYWLEITLSDGRQVGDMLERIFVLVNSGAKFTRRGAL